MDSNLNGPNSTETILENMFSKGFLTFKELMYVTDNAEFKVQLDSSKYSDIDRGDIAIALCRCFNGGEDILPCYGIIYQSGTPFSLSDIMVDFVTLPTLMDNYTGLDVINKIYTFLCLPVEVINKDTGEIIYKGSLFKYDTEYDDIYYNKAPRDIAQFFMDTVISEIRKILSLAKLKKDGFVKAEENEITEEVNAKDKKLYHEAIDGLEDMIDADDAMNMRATIISISKSTDTPKNMTLYRFYFKFLKLKKNLKKYYVKHDMEAAGWIALIASKVVTITMHYQTEKGDIVSCDIINTKILGSRAALGDIHRALDYSEETNSSSYEFVYRIASILETMWEVINNAIDTMPDDIKDKVYEIPYNDGLSYFKNSHDGFIYITKAEYRAGLTHHNGAILEEVESLRDNDLSDQVILHSINMCSARYVLSTMKVCIEYNDFDKLLGLVTKEYIMYYCDANKKYQLIHPETTKYLEGFVCGESITSIDDTKFKYIENTCGTMVAKYIKRLTDLFSMIKLM